MDNARKRRRAAGPFNRVAEFMPSMTIDDAGNAAAQEVSYVPGSPRIAYVQAGTGEPVVFLHGVGGNRHNWDAQIEPFSATHRVIAWDARGYLDSEDYDGPCRFEDFSSDLKRLLDHLGIDKAHLIGLSMGGRILMDFAARYPDKIGSLVLAGSFPSFGKALTPAQQDEYMRLRRQPLESGRSFRELAPELVQALLGPAASDGDRRALTRSIEQLRAGSYLKTLQATLGFDKSEEIKQITAPVLLIYGEHDRLVTPALGLQVHAAIRNSTYVVVPGVGHLINIEASRAFNDVVLKFIREHPIHKA